MGSVKGSAKFLDLMAQVAATDHKIRETAGAKHIQDILECWLGLDHRTRPDLGSFGDRPPTFSGKYNDLHASSIALQFHHIAWIAAS